MTVHRWKVVFLDDVNDIEITVKITDEDKTYAINRAKAKLKMRGYSPIDLDPYGDPISVKKIKKPKPMSAVAHTLIPRELCGMMRVTATGTESGGCTFLRDHEGDCTWAS